MQIVSFYPLLQMLQESTRIHMNIISKFLSNDTSAKEVSKLTSALRTHAKAINSFLSDWSKLDESDQNKNIMSLANSFRHEVAKSGVPFQHTRAMLDSIREQCKARRDSHKSLVEDCKRKGDFHGARQEAENFRRYDVMLSTAANLAGAIKSASDAGVTLSDAGATVAKAA